MNKKRCNALLPLVQLLPAVAAAAAVLFALPRTVPVLAAVPERLTAVLGYAFVDGYTKFLLLAAVQGACFGLATTAGITVAIDITTSTRRSAGNMVYMHGLHAWACWWVLCWALECIRCMVSVW